MSRHSIKKEYREFSTRSFQRDGSAEDSAPNKDTKPSDLERSNMKRTSTDTKDLRSESIGSPCRYNDQWNDKKNDYSERFQEKPADREYVMRQERGYSGASKYNCKLEDNRVLKKWTQTDREQTTSTSSTGWDDSNPRSSPYYPSKNAIKGYYVQTSESKIIEDPYQDTWDIPSPTGKLSNTQEIVENIKEGIGMPLGPILGS